MSSRQEEKERRRREREEAEQAANRSDARRTRLGMVVGGVLVAALIAVGVLAFSGGDSGPGEGKASASKAPTFKVTDLQQAAKDASCRIDNPKNEGNGHTSADVKYDANPPTSGAHDPTPSQEGVYPKAPDLEQSVHALEHGRINFQYKPGAPQQRISQLEGMFNEDVRGSAGYHSLMFENQTGMDAAVAATAWDHSITCATWNDKVYDALRAFREEYVDKGPELVP